MEELELIFDNEANVYLPQVVADENKRKANELERIANENERKANENERIANELDREASMNQMEKLFETLLSDLEAEYKKISYLGEYKQVYVTETEEEKIFNLPTEWTEKSIVWIYVNGMKLDVSEYVIDENARQVILTHTLDVIGTKVEILAFKLTTALLDEYDKLRGERGKSAYEIWLEEGNVGTEAEFLASLKGEKGEDGGSAITKVSELENDSGFVNEEQLNERIGDIESLLDTINGEVI